MPMNRLLHFTYIRETAGSVNFFIYFIVSRLSLHPIGMGSVNAGATRIRASLQEIGIRFLEQKRVGAEQVVDIERLPQLDAGLVDIQSFGPCTERSELSASLLR
jgi:hypothetical protein